MTDDNSTISALATAAGSAGVAIVRLSGPLSATIAGQLTGRNPVDLRHGAMRLARLRDEGGTIDRGYVVIFRGPRSFTGEDVAELHVHGSEAVTRRLLAAVNRLGARPAQRGEFSRRAYLSGKLDLSQAEGLLDLVSARSERARELALHHLDGQVSAAMASLRPPIVNAMADVEARLDFSTAEDVGAVPMHLRDGLKEVARRLRQIAQTASAGQVRMRGARVAIWGAPNVGKSTLFNALVGTQRALVHDQPGTTRDVLESPAEVNGIALTWIDTAGVRDTDQAVEAAGIERARGAAQSADIVLWLTDGTAPDPKLPPPPGPPHRQVIRMLSKADQPLCAELELLLRDHPVPRISALVREDVDRVLRWVEEAATQLAQPTVHADITLCRARQAEAMTRAAASIERALLILHREAELELAAADLQEAASALAEVTGQIVPDDVLDAVFSQFCIGK